MARLEQLAKDARDAGEGNMAAMLFALKGAMLSDSEDELADIVAQFSRRQRAILQERIAAFGARNN